MGVLHNQRTDNDNDTAQCIAKHMQKGATHVHLTGIMTMTMTRFLYRLLLLLLVCVIVLLIFAFIHVGQLGETAVVTCQATAMRVSMMSAMLCEGNRN